MKKEKTFFGHKLRVEPHLPLAMTNVAELSSFLITKTSKKVEERSGDRTQSVFITLISSSAACHCSGSHHSGPPTRPISGLLQLHLLRFPLAHSMHLLEVFPHAAAVITTFIAFLTEFSSSLLVKNLGFFMASFFTTIVALFAFSRMRTLPRLSAINPCWLRSSTRYFQGYSVAQYYSTGEDGPP